MGFWDFFRKNKDKEEIKVEKISIAELKPWLLAKKRQIEKQEEDFLKLALQRIYQLIQELEQELAILKKINVDEKKAEEKLKLIVKENLNNYIDYLERLVSRLREINKEKEIIEKINSIFSDFKKRSSISFEKATFLIGKELENVKESIGNFFRDLEKILEENKELIDRSKIISSVEKKIEKLNEIEKIRCEIEKLINEHNNKINSLKDGIKTKEEEIENIKKSERFLAESKKKEELEKKKEELEKEIYKLRETIDFKSLANFFHSFQKEMDIIKAYKENFKNAFQKNWGEDILSLLKEAKLQNINMLNKIEEIIEKKKEIESTIIDRSELEDLETEIRKIKSEIQVLNSKKFTEEKKHENLDRNLNEVIGAIREDLIKINVGVTNPVYSKGRS